MTGFGRASADVGERRLRVEIRSVNHRGLDLKLRGAEIDTFCEAEIARAVRAAVERGSVTVQVREESAAGSAGVDEESVRAVFGVLERLRAELDIDEPVTLTTIGAFIGMGQRATLSGEPLWDALRPAIDVALGELRAMREREGKALSDDLAGRRARLVELVAVVRGQAAGLPERFAHRLRDRLAGMQEPPGVDPGRLAQEVALMAERLDVSEELVRLETHLGHLGELLEASEPVGRKLDFLLQEIARELNTVVSKAQDAGVAAVIIEAKAELEKLREQAQNVE